MSNTLSTRLRKVAALSWADRWLLVQVFVLLGAARLTLRLIPLSPPGPFSQPIADRNAVVGIPSRPGINPTNQNGGADLGTGHSCVSSEIAV